MDAELLRFICANRGAANTDDLLFNVGVGQPENLTDVIAQNPDRFATTCVRGQPKVVARTALRLCRVKDCQGSCKPRALHLCKNFLFSGSCQYLSARGRCCFTHTLDSEHNDELLREHGLRSLSRTELCTLLLQNDNTLLPSICFDYNNGEGVHGHCKDGYDCKRLHICEKHLHHDCSCSRAHDFSAPLPLKKLQEKGVPDHLIPSLKCVYVNKAALRLRVNRGDGRNPAAVRGRGGPRRGRGNQGYQGNQQRNHSTHNIFAAVSSCGADQEPAPTSAAAANSDEHGARNRKKDKTAICMYFIKGHCKHEERCFKAHDRMPYRWQVRQAGEWTVLSQNEAIEKDYCDPDNTYSSSGSSPPVCFDTMTSGVNQVRRLSTVNSVKEPTFILTTEWLWYWEDEFGNWNLYASALQDGGRRPADIDSAALEQKFLDNDQDVVEFTANSQSYSLSFPDMIQTNKHYGTKRLVRRRPRFVSAVDVQTMRTRRPLLQRTLTAIPDYWDKKQVPQTGYKRVSLQESSDEYQEIQALFYRTMRGFAISQIERIQNKALWEVFQWQKNQMKDNNRGRIVTEKKLFHGTDAKHVNAICLTNFDWRLCGTHGTAYGQGSYFARDAKYSHSYTGDSDVKVMFVSRVLVGDFTKGSSEYRRPPSKDGGELHLFNSCVDDMMDPSIFVVFEKHQIYPEYLLHYKTAQTTTTTTPAYKPVPQPSQTPQPASTSFHPRSTPTYQPSTSSAMYRPTPAYQPPQMAPPSPPYQPPKKSPDSCIIA